MTTPLSVREYYADPFVRRRLREYLGVDATGAPTAASISAMTADVPPPVTWEHAWRGGAADLEIALDEEADISRSLLDSGSLIFFLELDHANPDAVGDPFRRPADVFAEMEPAYLAVRKTLARFGLMPTALISGRGYHFVGRVPREADVVKALARIVPAGTTEPAWAGMSCVVEYLAQQVLRACDGSRIPVVVNGLPVGQGSLGRGSVSIDFSYAGDPLAVRYIRCAFSTYQWHRFRPDIFGRSVSALEPLAVVPRGKASLQTALRRGRTMRAAMGIARRSTAEIPDVTSGLALLTADYRASPLAAFHRRFFADLGAARGSALPPNLPPCVQASLGRPNDLLLKPEHLQHLVRTLLSHGWPAVDIAWLVRRSYEAPHDWGDRWTMRMDPAMRAAFEVRVFAGLIATGVDTLIDFNCVSAQEKGLCPRSGCTHDLRTDRARLMEVQP